MSRRYRRGGPMYWYWGLLMFRHPGVVLVLLAVMFIVAQCHGG